MRLELTRDVESFASLAEGFLAERIERNVSATVLAHSRNGRFDLDQALFAVLLDERERVRATALRTPPWPMLPCELGAETAELLLESWLGEDPGLNGASGQPASARAVADAWRRRTGGTVECRAREAMHVLTEVLAPARPAPGKLSLAADGQRDLLLEWERAFWFEVGIGVAGQEERALAARLAAGGQFIWDDGGPVCAVAVSPTVAGTVRIGPVFTPAEQRGRGYASTAVAAVSTRALENAAERCMLLTDLSNPTSNKIYAAVGFRRFADWEELAFTAA
jgi:GNAT superfamily N-acetyltransferase